MTVKRKKFFYKWLPFFLSWWLILFPEMVFCSGMCQCFECVDDTVQQIEMDGEALWELLFQAEQEQISYKSYLWEWVSKKAEYTKEG